MSLFDPHIPPASRTTDDRDKPTAAPRPTRERDSLLRGGE